MDKQLNAIRMADAIRERLADFTAGDMFVRDTGLSEGMRRVWVGKGDGGGLVSDLWVEGAFPSIPSKDSLDSLVKSGAVCKGLRDLLQNNRYNKDGKPDPKGKPVFPADRLLHKHQAESLLVANAGYLQESKPAVVVTAGTGAGKTECFLLPMLNDLFRHQPHQGQGVSAIILYPMNALVNDQVDRLYDWLRGQRDITLFNFTSETPEDKRKADDADVPYWDICRIRTRQEARMLEERYDDNRSRQSKRSQVPRILVTNYSMLEYMLCRPQDSVFFGTNLRTLVLDEAHLYTGILAAEITLLQRRLLLRCGLEAKDVLQFATSATLGNPADLEPFAATLFSKDEADIRVIIGEQKKPDLPTVVNAPKPSANSICSRKWPSDQTNSCKALGETQLVHTLVDMLWEKKRIRLAGLSGKLFPDASLERAEEATRILLELCAAAREKEGDQPLLPNRIHFLFRGAQGFTVFFDSTKRKNSFMWNGWTVVPGHLERCPETETYGLSLVRCSECGEVFFHAVKDSEKGMLMAAPPLPRDEDAEEDTKRETPTEIFLNVPKVTANGQGCMEYVLDPATGHYGGHGGGGIKLREVVTCWRCNAASREFRAFVPSSGLIRNIAAETAVAEIPPKVGADSAWLPARGRRLLAFSDSRSSAAKLGPSLTRQHNRQVIRALIVRESPKIELDLIELLETEIQETRAKLAGAVSLAVRARLERQLLEKENELRQCQAGGSVIEWRDKLSSSPLVPEVFDAEASADHGKKEWSQRRWEEHAEFIRDKILPMRFMGELVRRPRWPQIALETLGLVEVVYPGLEELSYPDPLVGLLPPVIGEFFKANWAAFAASVLDSMRTDGAVTLGDEKLDKQYNDDMPYIALGKWFSLEESYSPLLIPLKGKDSKRHRRNAFLESCIKKTLFPAPEQAELDHWTDAVFENLFEQLIAKEGKDFSWLSSDDRQSGETSSAKALRIDFSKLALRKPLKLFRCATTGQVWPRSVADDAPARVRLDLQPVTDTELDQDARLGRQRREYREAKFFETGIWGDEHSAQLDPKENRRLQNLFKAGIRNLLSSTTTLELGIDIGGLNAVFMANLPPGKANYLQRAGRAGRRADGSSAVIGFARPTAYEQEVFRQFDRYLDGPLRRPTVFLDREQIVVRHWFAFLLGEFYRTLPRDAVGAMTAYGRMGWFCNLKTAPYWDQNSTRPTAQPSHNDTSGLNQFLVFLHQARTPKELASFEVARDRIHAGCAAPGVLKGEMSELLADAARCFDHSLKDWRKDYEAILKAWKDTDQQRFANKLHHQLKVLADMTVIETLANQRILPRYGFPIDLHALQVLSKWGRGEDFRLERKSLQALREYVPGSRLMVGNRTVTSHGILKHSVGEHALGLHGQLATCGNGHSFYAITPILGDCPYCGEPASLTQKNLLLPRNGYTTAAWDEPEYRYEPHVVRYHCPVYVQLHTSTEMESDFGDVSGLKAEWFKDGGILAVHDGARGKGFAVCTKCGYADSEQSDGEGRVGLTDGFAGHASLNNPNPSSHCWKDGEAPVLRNVTLAARQSTELLRLDFSPWLLRFGVPPHDAIVVALAAALKLAGARLLEIDVRELGMMEVFPAGEKGGGLGVLLYDDIPGGCGHVRDLMANAKEWLRRARKLLYGDANHHKSCLHGCIDCILSAFSIESKIQPDRLGAYDLLNALLSGKTWTTPAVASQPQTVTQQQLPLQTASQNARLLKQQIQTFISSNLIMPFEKKKWKAILGQLKEGSLSEQEIAIKLSELQNDR
ncbi:MAG TPA: DEAD/DEAH box helicase [Kiritimatiellia bacterium]|nr:DEAD/DEAH box helicase [Kiritimatiellia bacterium]